MSANSKRMVYVGKYFAKGGISNDSKKIEHPFQTLRLLSTSLTIEYTEKNIELSPVFAIRLSFRGKLCMY